MKRYKCEGRDKIVCIVRNGDGVEVGKGACLRTGEEGGHIARYSGEGVVEAVGEVGD